MHNRASTLVIALALLGAACSSNDNPQQPPQCPPCGAGMVCEPATAQCVAAQPGDPTCPVPCGANANCLATGSCGCAAGHVDCDGNLGTQGGNGCECAGSCNGSVCGTPGPGPSPDGGPPPPPPANPCASGCAEDERCEAQACVKIAPGSVVAELRLDHVFHEWDDSPVRQRHGEAQVMIYDTAPLPADKRQVLQLPNTGGSFGQSCTYEENTSYPWSYPTTASIWPPGKRLSAGKATFTVSGAPGPIEIDVRTSSIAGYTYFHDQVPPTLREGSATYLGLFSAANVPGGASFSVAFAGGPDAPAASFDGAKVAAAFTIQSPSAEASVPKTSDLALSWSPPEPGAKMRVILHQSKSGSVAISRRLVCVVDDTGTLSLPPSMLARFQDKAQLRLERWAATYHDGTATGGKPLSVRLLGRYITSRQITIQ